MENKLEFVPFDGYIATLHTESVLTKSQVTLSEKDFKRFDELIKEIKMTKINTKAIDNAIERM